MKRSILFVFLMLVLPATVFAQVNASVVGTVTDQTGALIPGAEVTSTNINTGIVNLSVSNETGSYNFASLQAGAYTVSASLPGFQTQTFENVTLSQGQQIRINFSLQVAAVGQAVEVVADADALLATTTASVGDALPEFEVRSLPLAERDVFDLIATTAGAVGYSFGGQRSSAVNVTRDGMLANDTRYLTNAGALTATYSSPDLIEEVQLVVGAVDAEAGRGSGQISFLDAVGNERFPWGPVLQQQQFGTECEHLVQQPAKPAQGLPEPDPVWRPRRGADHPEQAVLLRPDRQPALPEKTRHDRHGAD